MLHQLCPHFIIQLEIDCSKEHLNVHFVRLELEGPPDVRDKAVAREPSTAFFINREIRIIVLQVAVRVYQNLRLLELDFGFVAVIDHFNKEIKIAVVEEFCQRADHQTLIMDEQLADNVIKDLTCRHGPQLLKTRGKLGLEN